MGHYFLTWRSSRRKTSVCSGRKFVTKTYEQRKYQKCSSQPRLSSSPFPRWQARPNSFAWARQELHISGAAARQSIPTPKAKIVRAGITSGSHYNLSKKCRHYCSTGHDYRVHKHERHYEFRTTISMLSCRQARNSLLSS